MVLTNNDYTVLLNVWPQFSDSDQAWTVMNREEKLKEEILPVVRM